MHRDRMAKQNAKRAAHRDDDRKRQEAQDKILMLALSTGAEVAQDLNVWTLTWPMLEWHKEILKQEAEAGTTVPPVRQSRRRKQS
jgi:hypothetical protein